MSSVVALLAIGEGAQSDIVERISSVGTNVLNLQPQRGEGQRRDSPSRLSFDDADAIVTGVPNVLYSLPQVSGSMTIRHGHEDYSASVIGTLDTLPQAKSWPLAQGKFFTRHDSDNFTLARAAACPAHATFGRRRSRGHTRARRHSSALGAGAHAADVRPAAGDRPRRHPQRRAPAGARLIAHVPPPSLQDTSPCAARGLPFGR